jgi:hypothetical protein
VARAGGELVRSLSGDDGATWSAPQALGIAAVDVPHALEAVPEGVALAWTGPPPDTTQALPGVQLLQLAVSADGGAGWTPRAPLALRAGRVPQAPALAARQGALVALVGDRAGVSGTLACIDFEHAALQRLAQLPSPEAARGRYALDPGAARRALRLVCEHTLARPATSQRLFIEAYFMRSLVAAHEVLQAAPRRGDEIDTRLGLMRARAFADWLHSGQDARGYWPLGYKAIYLADMAVIVGLFAALEPHVEPAALQRFEAAAARFATALQRDAMMAANGACGVGWPETRTASEAAAVRDPYLVSTALAGIEAHAWLFHRTQRPEYRARGLAALEYTLSRLQPDGSFPPGPYAEGPLAVASYVHEGWMAADLWLQDGGLRDRLRRALRPHVDWLLRMQLADGTWTTGADGEFARTPSIVDFLIWYDQRCESRPDVQLAVRRASANLLDPARWPAYGLFRAGTHEEVLRALAGRPLAALVAERFVF